jgi:hypothetical protein
MTWRRILTSAVVFVATGLTTIVVVSPYTASPVQEYIAVRLVLRRRAQALAKPSATNTGKIRT